jgi:hypothetical protein
VARLPRWVGPVALGCYVAHAAEILVGYAPANLLWTCNVGALAAALGLLARAPAPTAVGAFLLVLGEPFWIIDLATGGALLYTAPLTHLGMLALALWGVRRLGLPRATWWLTSAAVSVATGAARLVGPPAENVDLAFAIPLGMGRPWLPHLAYLAALAVVLTAINLALQRGLGRLGFVPPPRPRPDGEPR